VADRLSILSPTGHLGFTPIERGSFDIGVGRHPDAIVADSGSCDIGPQPLGADEHCSPEEWQRHDLELMLLASRRLGVPMIVGSASDAGTDRGVHQYAEIIRELARRHRLAPFNLATIFSEVSRDEVARRLRNGVRVEGLDGRPDLTPETLARTDRVVAVMGVEPIIHAFDQGADVVIAGRSSDSCLFAAPALRGGFPEAAAYYLGKVLECASFAGEPFMGKESIIGTITADAVSVTAMHPGQRCTVASVASHAMYERANPFFEHVAGGVLDMTHCRYEQADERTTRVTGFEFRRDPVYRIKLEGSGKVGERAVSIAGIRDPYTIRHIDAVIGWARSKVEERWGEPGARYQLYYHVYGRDGIMGPSEPRRSTPAHELCLVVEAVAPRWEDAEVICALGTRNLFYARLPEVRGTAGTAALMMDEVLRGKPGYEWTVNHVLPLADPLELTTVKLEVVGR
jgi:acyclic terpene utilization AtuA family protein